MMRARSIPLGAREKMGTGSGRPVQNRHNIDDRPEPVPIFSQALGARTDSHLRVCEKMGTGSGPAMQNPNDIYDWPVPVPIFSQTLRRGVATPWLVVSFLALFWVFAWVIDVAMLRHRQQELKNAVDASVLAGANSLVADYLLSGGPSGQSIAIADARGVVQQYANFNRVNGQPLSLDANTDNYTNGDIVFGTLDHPGSHAFDVSLNSPLDLYHPYVNAVRVAVQRYGAGASATAFVDRDLIGFKIQGSLSVPLQRDMLTCGIPENNQGANAPHSRLPCRSSRWQCYRPVLPALRR